MSHAPLQAAPCGHLIERDPPECHLGRLVPQDCQPCRFYLAGLTQQERTRCEIWTRVMGYHRPVSAYNPGKQSEHAERRYFREQPIAPVGERQQVVLPEPVAVDPPSPAAPRVQLLEGAGHD